VEGIGYDFIPKVLDRSVVDEWIKTEDKESFIMARRLIKEEGFLCGGSSGSAVIAALKVCKTLPAGKRVVVILPDSTRNYMTKFLNTDWMTQNNFGDATTLAEQQREVDKWLGAKIRDLLPLPEVISIPTGTKCADTVKLMADRGFDQVPVLNEQHQFVGLVTVKDVLSKIASKRVNPTDSVDKIMFKFTTKRAFTPITLDTKLSDLTKFFERNSIAFVTQENAENIKVIKHVITKIDLLQYLMKVQK